MEGSEMKASYMFVLASKTGHVCGGSTHIKANNRLTLRIHRSVHKCCVGVSGRTLARNQRGNDSSFSVHNSLDRAAHNIHAKFQVPYDATGWSGENSL